MSCAHPAKIHIFPEVRLPENSRVPCSVDSVSQRTAAQSYLDLKLITILRDNRGRQLDSYSSVELDWGLSNSELGKLNREGIVVETKQVDGYPTLGRSESNNLYHLFVNVIENDILILCQVIVC